MIENFIKEYTGNVPNRTENTPLVFAENVYNYQLWIHQHFSPDVNMSLTDINAAMLEINTRSESVFQQAIDGGYSQSVIETKVGERALIGGQSTQLFKAKAGVASDDVVNKGQLDTSMPVGFIGMWSGSISDIPTKWALCDGTNNTPDLRGKFVYGASSDGEVNDTGGSKDAVVVEHDHTANHNHSASSSTNGNHAHSKTLSRRGNSTGDTSSYFKAGNSNTAGTYSGNTNGNGNHSHSIIINAKNVTTSKVGVSGTNKNLPPYMLLAYIIKVA